VRGRFIHLRYFSLPDVYLDFRRRFLSLLSYKFREFGSVTALSILEAANVGIKDEDGDKMKGILSRLVSEMVKP
jgi:N-acetyltransferase 10